MSYGGSRRPDLAARLRRGQRVLKSRLERPENVLALLRAAHDSLDPESIGKLVVDRADEWFKATACGVFAADLDGQVVALSSKGMGPALSPAALGVARWVIGARPRARGSDLGTAPRSAAVGGRGRWMAAAVPRAERGGPGGDGTAGGHADAATVARGGAALSVMLEGPAQALDNALRVETLGGLSVTDDLTQLYNSRYLNQVLRREAKRASRSGRPLSLLFMDLDGFKG